MNLSDAGYAFSPMNKEDKKATPLSCWMKTVEA
jgi:hypothetical protein